MGWSPFNRESVKRRNDYCWGSSPFPFPRSPLKYTGGVDSSAKITKKKKKGYCSRREPKMIANQPVVHFQFCLDSIAMQWNLIWKEYRKEWSEYLFYNLRRIYTKFTLEICYSIRFYDKRWSLRNDAGQTIAKMVNSDYYPNITPAV